MCVCFVVVVDLCMCIVAVVVIDRVSFGFISTIQLVIFERSASTSN